MLPPRLCKCKLNQTHSFPCALQLPHPFQLAPLLLRQQHRALGALDLPDALDRELPLRFVCLLGLTLLRLHLRSLLLLQL